VTLGELLGAIFGWLGETVQWLIHWVPQYQIVRWNEKAVKYHRGKEGRELAAGIHWYVPNLDDIDVHNVARTTLPIEEISLETKDGVPCTVGMVITYYIVDVVRYAMENFEPEESIAEVAQGELANLVRTHTWEELDQPTHEGSRLVKKLAGAMNKSLEKFGIEVETARPRDQVRLQQVVRAFGIHQQLLIGGQG